MGYLTKLNLHGVKCICGKPLIFHHPNHAICAACGLVTIYLLRRPARTSAIISGKKLEIALIIKIFFSQIPN